MIQINGILVKVDNFLVTLTIIDFAGVCETSSVQDKRTKSTGIHE